MSTVKEHLATIDLLVELAPPFNQVANESEERSRFEGRLLDLLDDLVEDLSLPLEPVVKVRATTQTSTGSDPIRIWINHQLCPVVRLTPAWPERTSELFPTIATAIVASRERFLSLELSQKIAEGLSSTVSAEVFQGFTGDQIHRLFASFLRRSFNLDRVVSRARPAQGLPPRASIPGSDQPIDSSDDLLPDLAAVSLKVFVRDPNDPIWANAWNEKLKSVNEQLFDELGLLLPPVRREADPRLEPEEFRIQINDVRHPPVSGLRANEILVNDTVDRVSKMKLNEMTVKAREAVSPVTGRLVFSIADGDDALTKALESAGLTIWDPLGYLVLHLAIAIRHHAGSLLTDGIVRYMVDTLKTVFPQLVAATRARCSISWLRRLLQALLDERISIRDLRSILEAVLGINGTTEPGLDGRLVVIPVASKLCLAPAPSSLEAVDFDVCIEQVRRSLKRAISHKNSRGTQTLVAYLLDPKIEQRICERSAHPLTAQERDSIRAAFAAEARHLPPTAVQIPVILTAPDIRRAVRDLIAGEFTLMPVTSYAELPPDLNVQPIARISLPTEFTFNTGVPSNPSTPTGEPANATLTSS